jgi:predicted RNase H-related nuclease YkuK (DUF458 family)
MKVFKTEQGSLVDAVKHTVESLNVYRDAKIYVGTDSQNKRYSTTYVTVIAYRYGHRGCHYIYHRQNVKKIRDRWQRLWKEVELSIEIAKMLEENSIKVFCIDLDFNQKEIARSSDMVAAARGYIIGSGFNCTVKPEEQVASRAADHLVRA